MRRRKRSAAQVATSRVVDADAERMLRGEESQYGEKVSFIPSDLMTEETVRGCHARGFDVVIVDEHGNEQFMPAPV